MDQHALAGEYGVIRTDDNGVTVWVHKHMSYVAACALCDVLTDRGHKQFYQVVTMDMEGCAS
jgi:hypothetical protein